jgi:HlyD family secretion protein
MGARTPPVAGDKKRTRGRLWKWSICLLVALGAGYWWWSAHPSGTKYHYETTKITQGDVTSRVTATGNLAPVTKVTVGSEVSGILLRIPVDYNSHVRKGQVLAEIDPTVIQTMIAQNQANLINFTAAFNQAVAHERDAVSAVRSAEAGIATARASVETARATHAGARAGVVGAHAQVARCRADYVNSSRNYQRYVKLLKKDLVARTDVDTAETTYLVAKATLEAQEATLNTAGATLR